MTEPRALLAFVAFGMVLINATIFLEFFPRDSAPATGGRALVVCYLLGVTAAFWGFLLFALFRPSLAGWAVALVGMNLMATAPLVWFGTRYWANADRPLAQGGWEWPALLAITLSTGEMLMGGALDVVSEGAGAFWPPGRSGVILAFSQSIDSPWYFWGMLGAMVPLLFWGVLARGERPIFVGLIASNALGPFVPSYPVQVALGMAGIMGGIMIVIVRELLREPPPSASFLSIAAGASGAFGLMNAGLWVAIVLPETVGPFAFAVASAVVMIGEIAFLARRTALPSQGGSVSKIACDQVEHEASGTSNRPI